MSAGKGRPAAVDLSWQARALCLHQDWHPWFPARGADLRPAQRICAECPVQDACREHGVLFEAFGVWGGTSERERRRIRRARGLPLNGLSSESASGVWGEVLSARMVGNTRGASGGWGPGNEARQYAGGGHR